MKIITHTKVSLSDINLHSDVVKAIQRSGSEGQLLFFLMGWVSVGQSPHSCGMMIA